MAVESTLMYPGRLMMPLGGQSSRCLCRRANPLEKAGQGQPDLGAASSFRVSKQSFGMFQKRAHAHWFQNVSNCLPILLVAGVLQQSISAKETGSGT